MPSCIDEGMAPFLEIFSRSTSQAAAMALEIGRGLGGELKAPDRSCAYALCMRVRVGRPLPGKPSCMHCAHLFFTCTRDTCIIYEHVSRSVYVCLSASKYVHPCS